MHDITNFTMSEMTRCGMALRNGCAATANMEESANRVVRYLHDHLTVGKTGERAMALVRFFKTHDYHDLNPGLRNFASNLLEGEPIPLGMKCLTLLATAGDQEAWNSRDASKRYKAIPLPSVKLVRRFSMISNLVKQFGLEMNSVLNPDPACLQDLEETSYNVFYLPRAEGSAYIPDQDHFVKPAGIKSVLGFGGLLPSGNLYAVIMFSKVMIQQEVADLFRPLTLSVKLAILEHDGEPILR